MIKAKEVLLVSIVVPVYNNALSLVDLLKQLQNVARPNNKENYEFVFVDDGSYDDSLSILIEMSKSECRMRIVKLSRNFGSTSALLAGLAHANGNVVAAIAADLQDPPELIEEMLKHWREGFKVVVAARKSRDDGFLSSLLSNIFYALFRRFAISTMPTGGFDVFLIDRQICDIIKYNTEKNVYLMGLLLWVGFKRKTIYYHRRKREKAYGRSMWSFARKVKYFIDSFVAFSYFPIRSASLLGICLSSLGMVYAAVVLGLRILYSIKVEGWASLMVVLLVVSGTQMLMIGILGEYLWRNLDETRKRASFIVEDIIEMSNADGRMLDDKEKIEGAL